MRLKDETEELKVQLEKIDVDQNSMSEELQAIERANALRVASAEKLQDDRELEVEAQNRRAQEECQRKLDEAIRNARASSDDVDEELKNCKLLIERSKSKLKIQKLKD